MRELSLVKARVFPDSKMQSGDCSYACQCTWRSVKEVSMIGIVESERQLCPHVRAPNADDAPNSKRQIDWLERLPAR